MVNTSNDPDRQQKPTVGNVAGSDWLESVPKDILINGEAYSALGQGAQATAYLKGHTVVKIGHTEEQLREHLQRSGADNARERAKESYKNWVGHLTTTKAHLESGRLDSWIIADARIDEEGRIWQSLVIPVENVFDVRSLDNYGSAEITGLIDKWIELTHAGWRCGLCEIESSLFLNYALRPVSEQLTIPDFGNATYSYEKAQKSVMGTIAPEEVQGFLRGDRMPQNDNWPDWFYRGQVREALRTHPTLFNYYVETMSAKVNLEHLNSLWPSKYR